MKLKSILSECWTGYKQVGMKNKGGRQVPNCVPESVNESDLKGYLVADVVDDIIKSIGTRFVSGQIKNGGNKNKVYLKLTDKKFGSGVIKILKSRFGIEAKYDTTFGYMPSVSFWGDKVISEASASDVIKDLDKVKNDLLKKVDVLVAKKKKLYSDVDIESPMSADEKKLDKEIADLFSQINQLVLQKRSLKKESANKEKVYIDYLNKAKGFKQDRIKFDSYEKAVKWAKKNFEKFSPDMIKYESINEGRNVKSVQKDLDKVLDNIQSALAQYKSHKGTDGEKKHIENLKKLNTLKKKLESELDSAVSGLYRDAELKIED